MELQSWTAYVFVLFFAVGPLYVNVDNTRLEYPLFSHNSFFATDWMQFQYYRWILHSFKSRCFLFCFLKRAEGICLYISFIYHVLWISNVHGHWAMSKICPLSKMSVQRKCFFELFFFFQFSAENKKFLRTISPVFNSEINPPW